MKHDYINDEIRDAWNHRKYLPGQRGKTLDNLKAFLEALPTRSAEPAEIAALKAALAESEKQFQNKVYEIACLLDECDKAQGILKACLSVMPFGNIETHTAENLPGRIADLASEIASLSLENERLEAELAALRQPLLADDGRSLGSVVENAMKPLHPYRLRRCHNPERVDESKVPDGWRFLYADEAGRRQDKPCRSWLDESLRFDPDHKYLGNLRDFTYIVPVNSSL